MAHTSTEQPRPALTVSHEEADKRIQQQIDRTKEVPNVSVNENDLARRWYDYTAELLRQIFITDELADEFTGRGGFSFGDDISVGHFLERLISIRERLGLHPADIPVFTCSVF